MTPLLRWGLVAAALLMAGLGSDPALAQPAPAGWKLAMAGDIMLGNDHPQPSLPPNQGRKIRSSV